MAEELDPVKKQMSLVNEGDALDGGAPSPTLLDMD